MSMFVSRKKLLESGTTVPGVITDVKRCWWLKVNSKPVRTTAMDGATFPHIITYAYAVDGKAYKGKYFISPSEQAPSVGQSATVYYDQLNPQKATVEYGY